MILKYPDVRFREADIARSGRMAAIGPKQTKFDFGPGRFVR